MEKGRATGEGRPAVFGLFDEPTGAPDIAFMVCQRLRFGFILGANLPDSVVVCVNVLPNAGGYHCDDDPG